jgi:predicted deacylase
MAIEVVDAVSTPTVVTSPARLWDQPLGLVRNYRLRATCSDAGGPVDVPVTVVTGVGPGPRVILIAGVHGDEVEGQFALQRLAETLEPAQLTGVVVMVLCANPLAALEGQRYTPEDGQDLNRVFPGNPQGSVSHRLAAALFEMVRAATYLMTLHSWYSTGSVLPYVEYPAAGDATAEASARAARACGLERIMPLDWHPGLIAAAIRIGLPASRPRLADWAKARRRARSCANG